MSKPNLTLHSGGGSKSKSRGPQVLGSRRLASCGETPRPLSDEPRFDTLTDDGDFAEKCIEIVKSRIDKLPIAELVYQALKTHHQAIWKDIVNRRAHKGTDPNSLVNKLYTSSEANDFAYNKTEDRLFILPGLVLCASSAPPASLDCFQYQTFKNGRLSGIAAVLAGALVISRGGEDLRAGTMETIIKLYPKGSPDLEEIEAEIGQGTGHSYLGRLEFPNVSRLRFSDGDNETPDNLGDVFDPSGYDLKTEHYLGHTVVNFA